MSFTVHPIPAISPEAAQTHENPAVRRCCQAFTDTFNTNCAQGQSEVLASFLAKQAYRQAMPALASSANIGDLMACVAYAILTGAIDRGDAPSLMKAARTIKNTRNTKKRKR